MKSLSHEVDLRTELLKKLPRVRSRRIQTDQPQNIVCGNDKHKAAASKPTKMLSKDRHCSNESWLMRAFFQHREDYGACYSNRPKKLSRAKQPHINSRSPKPSALGGLAIHIRLAEGTIAMLDIGPSIFLLSTISERGVTKRKSKTLGLSQCIIAAPERRAWVCAPCPAANPKCCLFKSLRTMNPLLGVPVIRPRTTWGLDAA